MVPYLVGFHYYWLTNFPHFSSIFFQFSSTVFHDFSSILGKIPGLFQSYQNSLTGKCLPVFPGFPVPVGTMKDMGLNVSKPRALRWGWAEYMEINAHSWNKPRLEMRLRETSSTNKSK